MDNKLILELHNQGYLIGKHIRNLMMVIYGRKHDNVINLVNKVQAVEQLILLYLFFCKY